jgi:tetratricopeptide (TPR) repeat protein
MYPLRYASNLRLRQAAAALFMAILAYDTYTRANAWSNPFEQNRDEVEHHPDSARDNGNMARQYATIATADPALNDLYYSRALGYFEKATAVDPNYTIGLFSTLLLSANRGKPVDSRWMPELRKRLQTGYLDNDVGNTLTSLVMCQFQEVCHFQKDDLYALLQAALANPSVVGGKRALVLSALSYYYLDISHDIPLAIDAMHRTIAISPQEPQFRLTLVKVLIPLGRFDEAKIELAGLKKADILHAYDEQIASVEKLMAEQEKNLGK